MKLAAQHRSAQPTRGVYVVLRRCASPFCICDMTILSRLPGNHRPMLITGRDAFPCPATGFVVIGNRTVVRQRL